MSIFHIHISFIQKNGATFWRCSLMTASWRAFQECQKLPAVNSKQITLGTKLLCNIQSASRLPICRRTQSARRCTSRRCSCSTCQMSGHLCWSPTTHADCTPRRYLAVVIWVRLFKAYMYYCMLIYYYYTSQYICKMYVM